MTSPDDYLWDRSGEPDPEVAALEKLLAPLAHDPARAYAGPSAGNRRGLRGIAFLVGLGALGAVAATLVLVLRHPPEMPLVGPEGQLAAGSVIETTDRAKELELGKHLGTITLGPGSLLRVKRLARDEARFALDRGKLTAFVTLEAKPRFFNVETPATTCVDLGCKYTLDVSKEGDAYVHVLTGRVCFQDGDREVYVPMGACCHARRGVGAGTPRFEDGKSPPALIAALRSFDDATEPAEREELAGCALKAVEASVEASKDRRDTLSAWHLLQDKDDSIVKAAAATLDKVFPGKNPCKGPWRRPTAADRDEWREHCAPYWY